MSKPSVAWYLNSAAAQLCQMGGFNRIETLKNDKPRVAQIKTMLFWQVYTWDKSMSLRLGRGSVIQDCDISITRDLDFSGFEHLANSTAVPQMWLSCADLQGRIYEQL